MRGSLEQEAVDDGEKDRRKNRRRPNRRPKLPGNSVSGKFNCLWVIFFFFVCGYNIVAVFVEMYLDDLVLLLSWECLLLCEFMRLSIVAGVWSLYGDEGMCLVVRY